MVYVQMFEGAAVFDNIAVSVCVCMYALMHLAGQLPLGSLSMQRLMIL